MVKFMKTNLVSALGVKANVKTLEWFKFLVLHSDFTNIN